jgi:hypothetical protein
MRNPDPKTSTSPATLPDSGRIRVYRLDELHTFRHLPTEGLRAERTRLETALRRLGERYQWQEIDEAAYHRDRLQLRARLAELPAPVDENVIAFDRAAAALRPMGEILRGAEPEHQRSILRHIVERVEIGDREVGRIAVRLESRPFFEDWPAAVVMAPPDGLEPLTT